MKRCYTFIRTASKYVADLLNDIWSADQLSGSKILYESCLDMFFVAYLCLFFSQINWTQYTLHIMALFLHRCHNGQAVWTYMGPMICFHLVEKHKPKHVLRQFSMLQMPPGICSTDRGLHQIDLRGKHDQDWSRIHAKHIGTWQLQNNFCA